MPIVLTIDQFADALSTSFFPTIVKAMEKGLEDGAEEIRKETERTIQKENLIYKGYLEDSVYTKPLIDGAEVGVSAPHAKWIEYGTRPFTPPLAPLGSWAMFKLGLDYEEAYAVAVGIQEKFSREGIKPRRFFVRSVLRAMPRVKRRVERRVQRAEKAIFRHVGRAVLG